MKKILTFGILFCFLFCTTDPIGADDTPKNRVGDETKYVVFVLGCKNNTITLCSVDKSLLESNKITEEIFSSFLKNAINEIGEAIAEVVASLFTGDEATQKSDDSKALKADVQRPRRLEFSPAEVKGCREVMKAGVLIHEYKMNADGSLGQQTEKEFLKADISKQEKKNLLPRK